MAKRIALFASGSGSNVENIINYFKGNSEVEIAGIYCNNPKAFVFERVKPYGHDVQLFTRDEFYSTSKIVDELIAKKVDLVILAGFLWLIPENLVKAFPDKMINIHPALLPNYGGKGMYGMKVHEAVVANKEKETGITIHYVNEHYDEGKIIIQAKCSIEETDTAEDVAKKIHALEFDHFPSTIAKLLK